MSSVSSANPGVADLLQTLSNVNSPVLSSPAAVSALESAPTSDIVELSQSATELENVDLLFGTPGSTASSSASLNNLLTELETAEPTTTAASTSSTATSPAEQLAGTQAAIQSAEVATLFGTGSSDSLPDTSLLNLIG